MDIEFLVSILWPRPPISISFIHFFQRSLHFPIHLTFPTLFRTHTHTHTPTQCFTPGTKLLAIPFSTSCVCMHLCLLRTRTNLTIHSAQQALNSKSEGVSVRVSSKLSNSGRFEYVSIANTTHWKPIWKTSTAHKNFNQRCTYTIQHGIKTATTTTMNPIHIADTWRVENATDKKSSLIFRVKINSNCTEDEKQNNDRVGERERKVYKRENNTIRKWRILQMQWRNRLCKCVL